MGISEYDLLRRIEVELQLFGTPSIETKKVSETKSGGPGVGLDIVRLNVVWPLGWIICFCFSKTNVY